MLPPQHQRLQVVDALRGFAVMAIMLVHFLEHFIYSSYPVASSSTWQLANQSFKDSFYFLFAGKSYTIFALLFGFTYAVQLRNQAAKGRDFAGRFAWRLLLLAGFACLNSLFFPGGDVLLTFSITGLILIPLRHLPAKALLPVCLFFLLQPQQIAYAIIQSFHPDWWPPVPAVKPLYESLKPFIDNADLPGMLGQNLTMGQFASLCWGIDAGRLMQAPGLFLLGMLLCKGDFFSNGTRQDRFWIVALLAGAASAFVFFICQRLPDSHSPWKTVFSMWHNIGFTSVWVAGFVLLYRHEFFARMVSPLRAYGKMSLTNYISQSFIGALVFFPFALGLAPHLNYIASFVLGLGVMAAQIAFCRFWLNRHRYGPLEGVWHKLTWWRSA